MCPIALLGDLPSSHCGFGKDECCRKTELIRCGYLFLFSRKYYEKPSHKFSSNGDSASTNPHSSSGSASAAAATASHSHAMRAYVTEPPLAGNRNLALPGSQPRTNAEAVREAETRIQTHIDEVLRQLTPRQQ